MAPMKHLYCAAWLCALPALAEQIVSPEVHTDGSVTFRLTAPKAREVRVSCEGIKDSEMKRDGNGVWTFTTPPLAPDIYVYSFNVDGLRTIDPNNSFLKYNLLNTESQVEVPGSDSIPWQVNDVPHGILHRHFYKSAVCGDERDYIVYTPPGYNPALHKYYPVLYLLHGYSDDTTAWTSVGRANVILDNLIARSEAKPMIVVMPLGYGTLDILKGGWGRVHDPELSQRNREKFSESLLTEVMPQVEKSYRIKADRRFHAIAGLSMGGTESLFVGLNHPEKFAWIGAFSSGGLNTTNFPVLFPKLDAGLNKQLRLLWISCGNEDKLLANNHDFCDLLKANDVKFAWSEPSGSHSFRVWRRNLATFVPLLFQPGK